MSRLTIGQLARRSGVHLETVRFYERRGLLSHPPRNHAGYRLFTDEAVDRIRFIKRAQGLGFTLDEIKDLLALKVEQGGACSVVEREARQVLARVDDRLKQLRQIRSVLVRLVRSCQERQSDDCPLLAALEAPEVPTAGLSTRRGPD